MKFKQYVQLIADGSGSIPTPHLRRRILRNPRPTAREEAIAAKILEEANPRENITGHHPWGPEQQVVWEQLWIDPATRMTEWRSISIVDAEKFYTTVPTKHGDLPVPNAILEPGVIQGDFNQRIKEVLGDQD